MKHHLPLILKSKILTYFEINVFFTSNFFRQTYTNTYDDLSESLGFVFSVDYEIPWNGEMKSLLPFFGRSSFSLKCVKVDSRLTNYIVKGTYNFKCKYVN